MLVSVFECPNGHNWHKPKMDWLVRSMHHANQALDVGERRLQTD